MQTANAQLEQWIRAGRTVVHEADTKELLRQAGVLIPRRDPTAGPCAVKLCSDQYPHKTEHGFVRLNVSAAQSHDVAAELRARESSGVILVEEMISDGVAEWIVGCRHDATFGPIVLVGAGGILVELIDEAKIRLAPLDARTAEKAIRSQRAVKVLEGLRGKPAGDVAALVDLVTRVSRFFADHADSIEQLEINPVIVRRAGQGAIVADALLVLRSVT
jgi:acyl-CoA synthetase (NDP forming)